jgi:tetratricopeptide (TPR) repeat protein
MSNKVIYTVGGTVQAGGGIYISRDADEELLQLCRAGEFCYVLAARQTGKSSLMVATRERLAAEGIRSVEIDLQSMGTKLTKLTAEQWYLGLIEIIVDQLDLDVDHVAWWNERTRLGLTHRLSQFLRQVVLEQVSEPVVIFIDEIDYTLNLDFTDDFFAAIRACYNARASDPAFKRLSFVLLGVATPTDLIKDPTRTPFNIGRQVNLTDFTKRQAIPLAAGLALTPMEAGQVLTWILAWTGGHPYLTQCLCIAAAASPTKGWDAEAVDRLVEKTFLGQQSAQDHNLRFVRDMLTQRAPDKAAVLKVYRRIHAGKAVPDEERSLAKTHLKLSGIVKAKDGYLHIRNEIYRRVFDLAWVRENIPTNWRRIVTYIAVVVAVLAVGVILYNVWVGIRLQDCVANFYQTSAPEEQVAHLAEIFRLRGLFGPTDYDYKARELFYGLSREEQLALFNTYGVKESDLIEVIRGLDVTLTDVDENVDDMRSTSPLLEAMAGALARLNGTEEAHILETEIDSWLEGRRLFKQASHDETLQAYENAISLNPENPATLYERARVHVKLSQYEQAAQDLELVMAIAAKAPAIPPTPTSTSTTIPASSPPTQSENLTPTRPPSAGVIASPIPLPTSTEMLMPTATPIPIAMPVPSSFASQFANTGQIRSAVKNLIDGSPELANLLASASTADYTKLREFGLVPTTPTPRPQTSTPSTDEYETDDFEPKDIILGQPQLHNFYPLYDMDNVKFLAKAGRYYRVYTSDLAPGVDTVLDVSVAGNHYAYNDDCTPGDLSSCVEFRARADGDMEASVKISNRGQFGPEMWYQITVEEFASMPTITSTPEPANVRLISELELVMANPTPRVGESVKAIFTVRNYGGQTFKAAKLLVKGRGPDDSIQDFPAIDNFELEPGEEFTYIEYRNFSMGGKHWFTPHYSPDGVHWFDLLFPNDQSSRVEITVDGLPVVEQITVEPSTINQGEAFVISVTASDDFGLQSVRWWSEGTGDDYLDRGYEASCGGVTRCSQRWPSLKWTGKDGEFPIYAEARDTADQVSREVSATITIAARFSLLIGGGPFSNESVQNALGAGINWGNLEEEIGEVILVDFLSEEALPGSTGMAYRPDLARELLTGAGYPDGFNVVLLFDPDDESAVELADLVASYLSVVGIRPEYLWVASVDARTRVSSMIAAGESGLLIERR